MRKLADLLEGWAPTIPNDVLRELEQGRSRAVLALHQQADAQLGQRQGLVGPWLSNESIQAIIAKIAGGTATLYLELGWTYAEDSAALAKIEDPHDFLERLAGKLINDAFELFREVAAGAWLQCGPLPRGCASTVEASAEPKEFVPLLSELKSETEDSAIFLGPLGWAVTSAIENVRRKLEQRILFKIAENTILPHGENDIAIEPVTGTVKKGYDYRSLLTAILAKRNIDQRTWIADHGFGRTNFMRFLAGHHVGEESGPAYAQAIEQDALLLGLIRSQN